MRQDGATEKGAQTRRTAKNCGRAFRTFVEWHAVIIPAMPCFKERHLSEELVQCLQGGLCRRARHGTAEHSTGGADCAIGRQRVASWAGEQSEVADQTEQFLGCTGLHPSQQLQPRKLQVPRCGLTVPAKPRARSHSRSPAPAKLRATNCLREFRCPLRSAGGNQAGQQPGLWDAFQVGKFARP